MVVWPMRIFIGLLSGVMLTGCVMRDSKASQVAPANVPLASFAGTYSNMATYASKSLVESVVDAKPGVADKSVVAGKPYVPDKINEYFTFRPYRQIMNPDFFRILPQTNGDILVEAWETNTLIGNAILKTNSDYTLDAGMINLKRKSYCGGGDSPGLFFGGEQTRICLDDKKNLIIISSWSGAGLFTIIPFGGYSKGMVVFPRVLDDEH